MRQAREQCWRQESVQTFVDEPGERNRASHLEKKGTPVASVWETMVNKVGMGLPEKFQGGQSKGVVAELV